MEQKDRLITMVEGEVNNDSKLMVQSLLGILNMKDPSVGTSSMFAILSAHFINVGCSKEEFLSICEETYSFYKLQIDEDNAKREKTNVNQ